MHLDRPCRRPRRRRRPAARCPRRSSSFGRWPNSSVSSTASGCRSKRSPSARICSGLGDSRSSQKKWSPSSSSSSRGSSAEWRTCTAASCRRRSHGRRSSSTRRPARPRRRPCRPRRRPARRPACAPGTAGSISSQATSAPSADDDRGDPQAVVEREHERLLDGVGRGAARRRSRPRRGRRPGRSRAPSPAGRAAAGRSCGGPGAVISAPRTATPNVPPTIRLIDSVPEATPALVGRRRSSPRCSSATSIRPMPRPIRTKAPAAGSRSRVSTADAHCQNSEPAVSSRPSGHQRPRADAVGQPAGDRADDDDHQRSRAGSARRPPAASSRGCSACRARGRRTSRASRTRR